MQLSLITQFKNNPKVAVFTAAFWAFMKKSRGIVQKVADWVVIIVQKVEFPVWENLLLTIQWVYDIIRCLRMGVLCPKTDKIIKISKKEEENANFQSACQTGPC